MKRFLKLCLPTAAVLLVAAAAWARQDGGGTWSVTTSDFETQRGGLLSVGEQGVSLQTGNETPRQIGRGQFVRMERLERLERSTAPAATANQDDGFVLHLRDGDRLRGTPTALGETAMTIRTELVGDVDVPLEQLLALTRPEAGNRPWRESPPAADEIVLANGDKLGGFVSGIGDGKLTVTANGGGGAATPVDLSAVKQVRFADPGLPPPAVPEKGWRVTTVAGTLFTTPTLDFADGRFRATCLGRPVALAEADVEAVEQAGGPVVWLSELYPTLDEQVPYLSAAFPTRVNGLSHGSGRGFLVHSKSTLRFDVPPGYARFRVRYQLADDAPRGDVSLRILLDDKPAHAVEHLTAGQSPAAVELPLNGAKSITLEVGYGAGLDVQDELEWIDPALVRSP